MLGLISRHAQRLVPTLGISLGLSLGLIVTTALLDQPPSALAAEIVVTTTADSGAGSLRNAIQSAAPSDTITVRATGNIELSGGAMFIAKSLKIVGPGPDKLTIRPPAGALESPYGAFIVNGAPGVVVDISGVTISNFKSQIGGAITVANARLNLSNCTIDSNALSLGSGGAVQAVETDLRIDRCTLSNNSAPTASAVSLYNSGGTISASTISHNKALSNGATIHALLAEASDRTLTINGSTIAFNTSPGSYAGIALGNMSNAPGRMTVRLKSTLMAKQSGQNITSLGGLTKLISDGNNFVDDTISGLTHGVNHDIVKRIDAKLGDLALNGGVTKTHALLTGSPAIDAGMSTGPTDQRGRPRTYNDIMYKNVMDGTDIGAFEHYPSDPR